MNVDVLLNNINLISQNAYRDPEALYVERNNKEDDSSPLVIKQNNRLIEIFLKAKNFFENGRQSRAIQLHSVLEANVEALNRLPKNEYLNEDTQSYTELFLAAQRYNQVVNTYLQGISLLDRKISLFDWLPPCTQLTLPEAAPIKATAVMQTSLDNIPPEQQPHVVEKDGFLGGHKLYHYNEAGTHISHEMEAIRIFSSTQFERLMSLAGKVIEAVAGVFGKEVTFFKKYHYFKNDEDKKGEVYAQDAPLSADRQGSSYWVGHATCVLNVPIPSQDGSSINVNIITDPVEGDLNKLLYPRMTEPARS
ncbi:MAG TPA: hypothetical protein VIH61_03505, partial [Waddliaceae bacterium]